MAALGMPDGDALEAARKAIDHLLRRLARDGRLSYYFHGTESYELLIAAIAAVRGLDVQVMQQHEIYKLAKCEAPLDGTPFRDLLTEMIETGAHKDLRWRVTQQFEACCRLLEVEQ
ncbi:MAG: hypothetical protein JWL63_3247 [Rhodocyclales bacterium]|nr:hypothetical protein [Rhodocyclales bacterium]